MATALAHAGGVLWVSPRRHLRGLSRYTVAGGVATASHVVLMGVLVEARGWLPALASIAGAALGAAVAYVLNRAWTFAAHDVPHRQALPRFLAVAGAGALLNGALVWVGTAVLGAHWLLAQAVATLVVLLASYTVNQRWSFSSPS